MDATGGLNDKGEHFSQYYLFSSCIQNTSNAFTWYEWRAIKTTITSGNDAQNSTMNEFGFQVD